MTAITHFMERQIHICLKMILIFFYYSLPQLVDMNTIY